MIISAPFLVSLLGSSAVLLIFFALWLLLRARGPVEERLDQYGAGNYAAATHPMAGGSGQQRYFSSGFKRFLAGLGLGPRLGLALVRADLPLTAAEFTLVIIGLSVLGFALGTIRFSPWLGLGLAPLFGALPVVYLRIRQRRRLRVFTEQLPDMLTLLTGALRAGYGLTQSLEILVERLPAPISDELARVTRAINLGTPIKQALHDMAERVGSDDLDLIVIVITVQHDIGGNLAETLEIIGETVRDRLQILREIRVLTAQQRFTGFVLALLPLVAAFLIFMVNPEYISRLFEPGWVRLLPIIAVVLQLMGYYVISRIVDIEV